MSLEVELGSHEIFNITPLYHKMDSNYHFKQNFYVNRDFKSNVIFYLLSL